MAVIDQRILIVAPSEAVWPYLSEAALYSRWNKTARQVSMLSTSLKGVGARRRCTDVSGNSLVEEMTAWLENIGYEYRVIEGPYRSFVGRVRMQPVPEGTVLTWEVDYHLRGWFGGARNLFGRRRRLRKQMSDSLRMLKRLVENSGVRLDRERQGRVAMQADPGLAARQARIRNEPTPRPASTPVALSPVPVTATAPTFAPTPLGEDDLPPLPNPVVSIPTAVPVSIPTSAPQPTPQIIGMREQPPTRPLFQEPPIKKDDTKPSLVIRLPAEPTAQSAADPLAGTYDTVPIELVAPKPIDPPPTATQNLIGPPLAPPQIPAATSDADPAMSPAASIWDVFGLARPSEVEKQDVDQIIAELKPKLPDVEPLRPPEAPTLVHDMGRFDVKQVTPPEPVEDAPYEPTLSLELAQEPPTPVTRKSEPPKPASRMHAVVGVIIPKFEPPPIPDGAKKRDSIPSTLRHAIRVRAAHAPTVSKATVRLRPAKRNTGDQPRHAR